MHSLHAFTGRPV